MLDAFRQKEAFALYRLPAADELCFISGDVEVLPESSLLPDAGFVIAPFDGEVKWVIRARRKQGVLLNSGVPGCEKSVAVETLFDDYHNLFDKAMAKLNSGQLEKVILSRVKIVGHNGVNHLIRLYEKLLCFYPNAFVYMFNTPDTGCWLGASPEPLLVAKNGFWHTASVAGTALSNIELNNVTWGEKERNEQAIVTRFIQRILEKNHVVDFLMTGPYTYSAGQVVHLRTDFSFSDNYDLKIINQLIKDLHPTPAVCGMPRDKALDFISSHEHHMRRNYAGYVGPWNINQQKALYVNIRCCCATKDELLIYSGGGITQDSDLLEEWMETENKALTIVNALELTYNE